LVNENHIGHPELMGSVKMPDRVCIGEFVSSLMTDLAYMD